MVTSGLALRLLALAMPTLPDKEVLRRLGRELLTPAGDDDNEATVPESSGCVTVGCTDTPGDCAGDRGRKV